MQVRCPQCASPIDTDIDDSLQDVLCPSCGSNFNLIGATETIAYTGDPATAIGHFELVQQVGVGQFGTVWKARDSQLDRTVAVKVPRKGQLSPRETEQFLREARAAAQLRHPNIVSVHEVGRSDESVYIVSDFVEGITLSDWLTGQTLTPREAAGLCLKVAEALEHAHAAGVVHRDLKPGNIMVTADGEPHIMDFGLAKRETGEVTMTTDGQLLGTPAYMSPEQARGEAHSADRRSDVYSLGAVLFQLLTQELPFRGNSRMILHQVLNEEPPSPRTLNVVVPRDLETICLKCLEKEPHRRYASAGEVAAELRRFLDGEPIDARAVTRVGRLWRWCRRKPVLAGLSATVLALLLFVAISAPLIAWHQASLRRNAESSEAEARRAQTAAKESAEDAERRRQEAEAARYEARTKVLQAYHNLAEARYSQARVLWNDRAANRQRLALQYLSEAGTLMQEANQLARTLKDDPEGWQRRNAEFWIDHVPRLRSEAVRWLTQTSAQELSRPPAVTIPYVRSGRQKFLVSRPATALSPDGNTLAVYRPPGNPEDEAASIELIDAVSGGLIKSLPLELAGAKTVYEVALAFAPHGNRLLIVRRDRTGFLGITTRYRVETVDLDTGQRAYLPLKGSDASYFTSRGSRVDFSADKRRVLLNVGPRYPTEVYDIGSGKRLVSIEPGVRVIGLAKNGKELVRRTEAGLVELVELKTGKVRPGPRLSTTDRRHSHLPDPATSPDGRWLAMLEPDQLYSARRQYKLRFVDLQTGIERGARPLHRNSRYSSMSTPDAVHAFSPDGRLLAVVTFEWFYLFSAPDGALLFSRRHPEIAPEADSRSSYSGRSPWEPASVEFAANGTRLVLALKQVEPRTNDGSRFAFQVWDIAAGTIPAKAFEHQRAVLATTFGARAGELLTAGKGEVLHDWKIGGESRWSAGYGPGSGSRRFGPGGFSTDGSVFVRRFPDRVDVWDPRGGRLRRSFPAESVVAMSPGRRYVAVRARNASNVRVFDTAANRWQADFRWDLPPGSRVDVRFDPKEQFLLATVTDRGIHVGRLADGATVLRREPAPGAFRVVRPAISHDGKTFLLKFEDVQSGISALELWQLAPVRRLARFQGKAGQAFEVDRAAFTEDGNAVAFSVRPRANYNDQRPVVWRFREARLQTIDSSWTQSPELLPLAGDRLLVRGSKAAAGNTRYVTELWDVGAAKRLATTEPLTNPGHGFVSGPPAFVSAHGTLGVAYGTKKGAETVVWDLKSGETMATYVGRPRQLSPDGRFLLMDDTVQLIDMKTGVLHLKPEGILLAGDLSLPSHGKLLITRDYQRGGLVLWDLDRSSRTRQGGFRRLLKSVFGGEERGTVIPNSFGRSFAISPDGWTLVTDPGNGRPVLNVWNLKERRLDRTFRIATAQNHVSGNGSPAAEELLFSSDGKRLAVRVRGQYRLIDFQTGEMKAVLDRPGHAADVTSIARSPDGTLVASASGDGTINLWRAKDGRFAGMLDGFGEAVVQVAFASRGDVLVAREAGGDLTAWKLNVAHDEALATIVSATVLWRSSRNATCVVARPGRSLIAIGDAGGRIALRDAATGKETSLLKGDDSRGVVAMAFSPEGDRLVAVDAVGEMRLWNVAAGRVERRWRTGQGAVAAVAVSNRTEFIATAGNGVRLWRPGLDRPLLTFRQHAAAVRDVAFDADGKLLASGGEDRMVYLVDLQQVGARLKSLKLSW